MPKWEYAIMPRKLFAHLRRFFTNSFVKFVAKKVVFYAIVMFVAMTFVFFIPRIVPVNPIDLMIPRPSGGISPEQYAEIRNYYMRFFGLDKPLFDQYIIFWRQILTLDLGRSFPTSSVVSWPRPVLGAILGFLPFTLALVIPVLLLSFILGNWIGARAAYVGGKRSELAYFFSVFSNRLPCFWLGMVLLFLLATRAGLFPTVGWISLRVKPPSLDLDTFLDVLWHYCLPFLSLFIVYLGGWATGMRSMVIYEMDSGYVRYSDQLGFRKSKSMAYAKRNAILPQFTGINLYLNALIGETTIIENIFGWPGIGRLLVDSVMTSNFPMITGCFLVIMVVVIFGNFLIDILYGFVDPRIRIGRR